MPSDEIQSLSADFSNPCGSKSSSPVAKSRFRSSCARQKTPKSSSLSLRITEQRPSFPQVQQRTDRASALSWLTTRGVAYHDIDMPPLSAAGDDVQVQAPVV